MSARNPSRAIRGEHRRALVRLIERISRHAGTSRWDVFQNFVELCAICIANTAPANATEHDLREARYHELRAGYVPATFTLFSEALGELILATETEGGDVLGEVFQALELNSEWRGQFFTPYSVSQMMAAMIGVPDEALKGRSFDKPLTILDPAIGAGSLLIACCDAWRKGGLDYVSCAHLTGIDIDERCVHMAYTQLAIRGTAAVVIHGNGLTGEQWAVWRTPMHVQLGWDARLFQPQEPELVQVVKRARASGQMNQMSLFGPAEKRAS